MKLTPWFPPHIKPVRQGFYNTGLDNYEPIDRTWESNFNWWWDGEKWLGTKTGYTPTSQKRWWRGIER